MRTTTQKSTTRRPHLVAATALAATALVGGTAYAATPTTAPVAAPAASASAALGAAAAVAPTQTHVRLKPSSPQLANCFPLARARVTVNLTTDQIGKDKFTVKAHGLKPRTDFTVFLIEKADAPFGAAEYIGDITTNRWGNATNTFNLIVEEAFAFNNVTHARSELNSVGVWFADEKDDDGCLGAASPVTGFDGDAAAGVQMLNSGVHLLP